MSNDCYLSPTVGSTHIVVIGKSKTQYFMNFNIIGFKDNKLYIYNIIYKIFVM